jgi:hypothetical protein
MEDEILTAAEVESIVAQRTRDGFGYFMVSVFHDSPDDDQVYGRMVVVRARDIAHARTLPLRAGEIVDGVDPETEDMFKWCARHKDGAVDLLAEAA